MAICGCFYHCINNVAGRKMLFNVFNPFQPSVAFHVENSHLLCFVNEMAGFYMEGKIGWKQVKAVY